MDGQRVDRVIVSCRPDEEDSSEADGEAAQAESLKEEDSRG